MEVTTVRYEAIKEKNIKGRYITNIELENFMQRYSEVLTNKSTGTSVEGVPIHIITIGNGPIKVLMWSQMHGNESTTTKALLDLLAFFSKGSGLANQILNNCTLTLIPILNPDGAAIYTRFNANKIDLNRDAQDRSQPESKLLRSIYDTFEPDYCFNLHDQRTIFNVGTTSKPATVSFLAPAADTDRSETASRIVSMQLIAVMNKVLQNIIPGAVGRYDDSFNANCIGDCFQMLGTPTVLIEAGHTAGDYQREYTRQYVFFAILAGLKGIAEQSLAQEKKLEYHNIPENNKLFFDLLIHNIHSIHPQYQKGESIGILYKEVLKENKIEFHPYIEASGRLTDKLGHEVFDCKNISDLEKLKKHRAVYELCI
ncbi:M14 metallopeptidase family protein [Muriicola sp. Z0-33]|uniref:M14 family metallopeptidase n=1 Tax=Muriicola sp. Z0-33 TaxID=2816957 RepID=UPI00223735E4|nr:M14 metallopeptidase family protein [Muriicola sp. Z0-33]MCW5516687.1 peptidase M14 [Muriicola sp. Z0-33]